MASKTLHKTMSTIGAARIFRRYLMLRTGPAYHKLISPIRRLGQLFFQLHVNDHHSLAELTIDAAHHFGTQIPQQPIWKLPCCKMRLDQRKYTMEVSFWK